jgi:hypothetical protein
MRMIIGRLLTSLNSLGTIWGGVGRRDDDSRKNVRNVRKDSSAHRLRRQVSTLDDDFG